MEKHSLEKYFNQRIANHQEHIDKDALWDDLGLEAEDTSKKRVMFWIIPFGILMICSIAFLLSSDTITMHELPQIESDVMEDHSKTINQTVLELNSKRKKSFNGNQNYVKTQETQSKTLFNNENENSHQKKISIKGNSNYLSEPTQSLDLIPLNKNDNSRNEKKQYLNKEIAIKTNDEEYDRFLDLNKKISAVAKAIDVKNNVYKNDIVYNNENNLNNYPTENILKKEGSRISLGKSTITRTSQLIELTSIQSIATNAMIFVNEVSPKMGLPQPSLIEPLKNNNRWSVGIYSDLALIDKNLAISSLTTDTILSYVENRNLTETSLERLGFGAFIKYNSPTGFYAKLGINHTSINSRLRTTININEEITGDGPLTVLIRENMDTLYSNFGELVEESTIEREYTIYNSHKIINIPVTVGYRIDVKRWSIFAEMSPAISLNHTFNGFYFNGISLVNNPTIVDKSTKYSLDLAMGVAYMISDKFSLWMQPYYQKTFNSFTTDLSEQDEKYNFYGLRIGTEMSF